MSNRSGHRLPIARYLLRYLVTPEIIRALRSGKYFFIEYATFVASLAGAIGIGAIALFTWLESPSSRLSPSPAIIEVRITPKLAVVSDITFFADGSVCREYVDLFDKTKEGQWIAVLDPLTHAPVLDQYTVTPRSWRDYTLKHRERCIEVWPDSDRDHMAVSRRALGETLTRIPLLTSMPSTVVGLGTVVAILVAWVVAIGAYVVGFVVLALGRAAATIVRALITPAGEEWLREERADAQYIPFLVQISDLHISMKHPYEVVENPELWPANQGALDTTERLAAVLKRVLADHPNLRCLALTGDITDRGLTEEWMRVHNELIHFNAGWRMIMIPGNHDVSLNVGEAPDHSGLARANRSGRYHVFREVLSASGRVARPSNDAGWRFPEIYSLAGLFSVLVIAIDSCRYASRQVFSNSVGLCGRGQLRRIKSVLKRHSGPVVVLIHHHVARSKEEGHGVAARLLSCFTIAGDSRRLLRMLSRYRASDSQNHVLVLHGHTHQYRRQTYCSWFGEPVFVYGHSSSTMGTDRGGRLSGMLSYAVVSYSAKGGFHVATTEWAHQGVDEVLSGSV